MGEVIGPIDRAGWITLRNLKRTMKFMSEDSKRYQATLKKEKELFPFLIQVFK